MDLKIITGLFETLKNKKGGWGVSLALLILLISCYIARIKESRQDKDQARMDEKEVRQILMDELRKDLKASTAPLNEQIKDYQKAVDTLQNKVDTIAKNGNL